MADAARKAVQSVLLDLWTRGPSLRPLLTDLGPVARGGDSVDVPSIGASTVNTSETASPEATSFSVDTLTVNRPKFVNKAVTQTQWAQLLNGNGRTVTEVMREATGRLANGIDRDIVEYLITQIAGAAATNHFNLAADALSDDDVYDAEADLREQDGIANSNEGMVWLLNPIFAGRVKGVAAFNNLAQDRSGAEQGVALGLPQVGFLGGIPAFTHNAVPGRTTSQRQSAVASASNIATNVATATVPTGHGFVAGQLIYTDGFTTDVAVGSPVAISSTTSTTIVYPLTASDGSNGTGTIYSASSMGILAYAPWIFFALDRAVPFEEMVKREGNAGWSLQLFNQLGRVAHAGSIRIVHAAD